ncbi:MAG: efflux RND transporter periplasmic adaptor subunit [Gammaproteobacteria bacterium]
MAAVLSGCGGSEPQGPAMMFGGGPVAVIVTEVAAQNYVDRFTALGTARANESIEVTSRISSIVTGIHFEEGQRVAAGDLLVELDNAEIRADLARAEASLRQKRSQFKRSRTLGETRVVSDAELEQLEAGVLMAEAEVRGAAARLENSYVRAPFSGTVGLRRISLGDLVGPDTIMTTLDDADTIKLAFTIPETFLSSLEADMPIEARSNVYPDRTFVGAVRTIDSRVDAVTRSLTVIAHLPNDENLIRPGMFLTVAVEKERDNVLLIPEEALVPRQGRQFVFVIEDGKAVERQVELGARAPGLAEVRRGLAPGDTIVTEGTQKVRNGAAVEIVSAS